MVKWGGSGALSALFLVFLDSAGLPAQDRSIATVAAIAGLVIPLGAASGVLLRCFWLAVSLFVNIMPVAHTKRRDLYAAAFVSLIVLVPSHYFIAYLASGPRARHLFSGAGLKVFLTLAVTGFLAALFWAVNRYRRWMNGVRRAGWAVFAAATFWGGSGLIYVIDTRAYRRLYSELHDLLALGAFFMGLLGGLAVFRSVSVRRNPAIRPASVVLNAASSQRQNVRGSLLLLSLAVLGIALGTSSWYLSRDFKSRFLLAEHTTVAGKFLRWLPVVVSQAPSRPTRLMGVQSADRPRRAPLQGQVLNDANLLLLTVDALRADHLGVYGYKRKTSPRIDRFSQRSIRFESAYAPIPLTCYSIPSLMTGSYLRATLALREATSASSTSGLLPPTMADILSRSGYQVAAFYNRSIFYCDDQDAKAYGDRNFGFHYAETELRPAADLATRVVAYLDRMGAAVETNSAQKFFLWAHFFDVHEPYRRHRDDDTVADFGARAIDRYDSEISYVDRAIDRVLAAVEKLARPTIVILTSDHGEEFGEHGGRYHGSSLYEEQIRVPLIVFVPGIRGGRAHRQAVSTVDIMPTVLSLLGVRTPRSVSGTSFVDCLVDQTCTDTPVFAEVHTKKMARFGDWKLIHDFRRGTYELYQLANDPKERRNQVAEVPEQVAILRSHLRAWYEHTRAQTSATSDRNHPIALDVGRLGDRDAVPELTKLVNDMNAELRWRIEAANVLGSLQDARARGALARVLRSELDGPLFFEAAIALGEMQDKRSQPALEKALQSKDSAIRIRAGIAAARVKMPSATAALLEGLAGSDWEIQNRCAHYLGLVGGPSALGPLIAAAEQLYLRGRVAVALGRLGRRHPDARILSFLARLVAEDRHFEVRQRAAAALGILGDRAAIPFLLEMMAKAPELDTTVESVLRLGALDDSRAKTVGGSSARNTARFAIVGVDFKPGTQALIRGLDDCVERKMSSILKYSGARSCRLCRHGLIVPLTITRDRFGSRGRRGLTAPTMRIRIYNKASQGRLKMHLFLNKRALSAVAIPSGWSSQRINVPMGFLVVGKNTLELSFTCERPNGPGRRSASPMTTHAGAPLDREPIRIDYILVTPGKTVAADHG